MKILAINPGSTSTKIALYEDENLVWKESIEHSLTELAAYSDIYAQYPMRIQLITEAMAKNDTKLEDLACVVGRGGPAMPFQAGAYRLNADLVHVLADHPKNSHIALLGGILAYNLAQETGIPAFIYDAVSTDEFEDVARFSGLKSIERISAGHYLNMRAAARKVAADLGTTVYDLNLIIAHLGGGLTISIMRKGRIVDLISDDEGPFSPERTGGLPLRQVVDMCYSGMDKESVKKQLRGHGGLVSYLGVTDLRKVEYWIDQGQEYPKQVFDAMAYQIANFVSYLAPVVSGDLQGIIFTGGMAYSDRLMAALRAKVSFLAPVYVVPGENELKALALGALRVMRGEEEAHVYTAEEPQEEPQG